MKKTPSHVRTLGALALSLGVSLMPMACAGGGDGDGDVDVDEELSAPITLDDIVDLEDLITQEQEATAAAIQVGDPAQLLGIAQDEAERARSHVAAILDRVHAITEREPDETGVRNGRPYGIWNGSRDGVDFRFVAARITADRVRYLLQGKAVDDTEMTNLLTGVFVKKGDRKGGGRLHLSLSNLSDLGLGPNADGAIHFMFANNGADKRGRRIVYRGLKERDVEDAVVRNYAADLVRHVGVGGRFRSVAIADIITERPGRELFALRVRWKRGIGGRGDAAVVGATLTGREVLGHAHECWDSDGLRTAYADTFALNDAENPNAGDVRNCFDLAEETVPEDAAAEDGTDNDEELDEILDEAGANDVTEGEAGSADGVNM